MKWNSWREKSKKEKFANKSVERKERTSCKIKLTSVARPSLHDILFELMKFHSLF